MRKTLISLIVLVSLLFSFNISYAAQYPMRENYYHDGVNIIERIYELDTDQEPSAEAKQSFERDGYFYALVSITKNEKSEVDEKDYRETVTVDSSSKNIGDILPLLEKEKEFTTADGYQGVLKLDESSIKVETKGYKSSSKTIQAYRTYPNLLNADLAYIPKTITEDGEVLELADISWERDLTYNPDDYAIGERYIANALYQGTKTYSYASGYLVSADYAGKVTKEIDTKDIYTLTFDGEKEHSLLLIGLISVCGAALVVLGILLYRRQRNGIEEENEEENTEEELQKKVKMRRESKMRIKIKILSLALAGAFILSNGNMALAKEYFYDEAINDLPQSTSVSLPEVIGGEDIYKRDVSKNAAILPPPFGSPQAAQPNRGIIISASTGTNYAPTVPPIIYPTEQESVFYADGSLGTLTIPALDLAVKVYEGEENLSKGVGHFADTPLWQGNVAIAGHNRGVNSYFGEIHTLNWGDKIIYNTKFGTKTYQVQTVRKIKATDFTFLKETADNRLTLITCVKNEPDYRWCVQAKEV